MAKIRDRNKTRQFFQPMEATHTSNWFDHKYDTNEQKTIQTLTDEAIVISGYMVYYVFRTEMDVDEVLFEPNTSSFNEAFQIAVTFPEYVMGWDNADTLLSKFGIQQNPQGEFILSQRAWDKIMEERESQGLYTHHRPREGDLIVIYDNQRWENNNPGNNSSDIAKEAGVKSESRRIFQITFVNVGKNNWQLGKDYVWRISASAYKYDESETLGAFDDFDAELFNVVEDFEFSNQDEAFATEEKKTRLFDENNPFEGY